MLTQAMCRLVCRKQADRPEGNKSYNNPAVPAVCPFRLDFTTQAEMRWFVNTRYGTSYHHEQDENL